MNAGINILEDEFYYPNVAVAAIDLLGMKELLKKRDKCQTAMKALIWLRKNSKLMQNAHQDDLPKNLGNKLKLYESGIFFSDSVYFYGNIDHGIKDQIDRLTPLCGALIGWGLCNKLPVRAGIAVGDLRIKLMQRCGLADIRIGQSMARSLELQESQEWIGGAVESYCQSPSMDFNRIKYDVPLKQNKMCSKPVLEAINWVSPLARGITDEINGSLKKYSKDGVHDLVKNTMIVPNDCESERVKFKLENTLNFVEHVFSRPEYL